MNFSLQLPTDRVQHGAEFVGAEAIGELARAAEEAGFGACFVTDHPFPPARWVDAGGHHSLDPFVTLSFAAAATRALRLQTNILVLPYRNPFLTAKAVATLDVLSGGRVTVGVAAGYLAGEFAALGVDPQERNELADEALRAMVAAWTQESVDFAGRHFTARGNVMLPRPVQQPHPPLWIGGNSRSAIRLAVEHGDGWVPFPNPPSLARHVRTAAIASVEDLETRIAYAREHAHAIGRTRPLTICFSPLALTMRGDGVYDPPALLDEITRYSELGVGWLCVGFPADTRAALRAQLDRFGDRIIAKTGAPR